MVDALEFARSVNGPVVLEFVVEMEGCFPNGAGGCGLDDMIRRPIRRTDSAD